MNGKNGFSNGKQCNWIHDNHGEITIQYIGANQSKDKEIRGRVEPDLKEAIGAFCLGRKITETDFIRNFTRLGPAWFDLVDDLVEHSEFLVPFFKRPDAISLLKRLSTFFAQGCSTTGADMSRECSTNEKE